jgi:hypothetical protein
MPIRIRQIGLDSCGNPGGGGGGGGCGCCSACCGGAFTRSFDNTDLVGGVLSVTHGLGSQYVDVSVYDENDMMIVPDDVVAVSATVVDIYLTTFTVVPTWNVLVISATGGGGIPGGPNTSIQFNDGGTFGGEAVFAYDKVNNRVHLTGSFSQGLQTTASNDYSHAQGEESEASGYASHAEGYLTIASNNYSHAEGKETQATNEYSHAEGDTTTASGYASHAEGTSTTASGIASHAEGLTATATGNYSHAEGEEATASGIASHAEGYQTTASNDYSHAEGDNTTASGLTSHAEGLETIAEGDYSHAEGDNTRVTSAATGGHAEGQKTLSSNDYAHVEGYLTTGSGRYSHAEGNNTIAQGTGAHAEGLNTWARSNYSHVEGLGTITYGLYSNASGEYTIASGSAQTVCGKYNVRNNDFSLFVVGNGTGDLNANRKDVLRVNPGVANIGRVEVTGSLVVTKYYAGDSETLTSAGAVDQKLHLTMFNTVGPQKVFTLADGDNIGQLKYFADLSVFGTGASNKLIPTTTLGSWSYIVFAMQNETATLMWTPQGWSILSIYGATVT